MTKPSGPAAIVLHNVSAWYGSLQALFRIDLTVEPGGVTALVGSNGAGKSTIIRSVLGLVHLRGSVVLYGKEYGRKPCHRRVSEAMVGVVHEGRGLLYELSVLDNVRLGSAGMGRRAAEAALERFAGLNGRWDERVGLLSGGEQQMVALARIYAQGPRLVLLDEPGLGLSPKLVDEVYGHLAELRRSAGVTIVLVEQSLDRAFDFADSFAVVRAGRVVRVVSKEDSGGRRRIEADILGESEPQP